MKLNRRILVSFGRDGDLLKLVKGNDEYAYMYVGGNDRPRHTASEGSRKAVTLSTVMGKDEGGGCPIRDATDAVGGVMDVVEEEVEVVEGNIYRLQYGVNGYWCDSGLSCIYIIV